MKPIDIFVKDLPVNNPMRMAAMARDNKNLKYCPSCEKFYEPTASVKEEASSAISKEQWISGICSDKCWDDYMGPIE